MDIKGKVNKLIKKHDTSSPFEIADARGVFVIYENLGTNLGYYNKLFRIPMIHIHESASREEQAFICAHELGHAVCHPDANTPFLRRNTFFSTDKIEKEANTFAVELLMPDKLLMEYAYTSTTIYEAAEIYGVPQELAPLKIF